MDLNRCEVQKVENKNANNRLEQTQGARKLYNEKLNFAYWTGTHVLRPGRDSNKTNSILGREKFLEKHKTPPTLTEKWMTRSRKFPKD